MFFAVYGAAGNAATPMLLLHVHADLVMVGGGSCFSSGQMGSCRWGGNYKHVNLLCIAANGSCLQ